MFTSAPITETIDIIWNLFYNCNGISTVLTMEEMKKLLTLCTKMYISHWIMTSILQNDKVAMGSSLGLILASVFMVEPENKLVHMSRSGDAM